MVYSQFFSFKERRRAIPSIILEGNNNSISIVLWVTDKKFHRSVHILFNESFYSAWKFPPTSDENKSDSNSDIKIDSSCSDPSNVLATNNEGKQRKTLMYAKFQFLSCLLCEMQKSEKKTEKFLVFRGQGTQQKFSKWLYLMQIFAFSSQLQLFINPLCQKQRIHVRV